MNADDDANSDSDSDSLFEYQSSCSSGDEYEEEEEVPWTPSLGGEGIRARVLSILGWNCCQQKCVKDKAAAVEKFVYSYANMDKDAQRTSLLTALAMSSSIKATKRSYGTGQRHRYVYFLPHCGEVCRETFQWCYEISNDTLTRTRNQVRDGHAYVLPHRNMGKKNAKVLDDVVLTQWFRGFAQRLGDESAVRFRRQETVDGRTVRYVLRQPIRFLPAHFTWPNLLKEYQNYLSLVLETGTIRAPSIRSFQTILASRCQDIRVRAPQSNVCDICAIYKNSMSRSATALDAENAAMHAMDARSMREQYAKDTGIISEDHAVSTIDFAQNVALPHVHQTPSAWYFLSLISISLFGIFSENSKRQTNYVYSERIAGKGSNEVISMLDQFARSKSVYSSDHQRSWTIYADNCGGQNKNNNLIQFLLFLVDSGQLKSANLYFFVK